MDSPYKLKTEQSTPASEDLTQKMMAEIPAIETKVLELAEKSTNAPVYPTYAPIKDISNQETSSLNPGEISITTPIFRTFHNQVWTSMFDSVSQVQVKVQYHNTEQLYNGYRKHNNIE